MTLTILFSFALIIVGLLGTGPATAGFTYVLRNFSREEHAWVFSDFREHSMKNFKQSLVVLLIDLAALLMFNINLQFYSMQLGQGMIFSVMYYLFIVLMVIFVIMHFYIYTIMVTFDMKLKDLIKNAFLFALMKLPINVLLLILLLFISGAACFLVPFPFPLSALVIALFAYSLMGLIVQFYAHKVVLRHMVDPATIKEAEEEDAPTFEDNI